MKDRLHELLLYTCTWCMNPILKGGEIFAFGVKSSGEQPINRDHSIINAAPAIRDKRRWTLGMAELLQSLKNFQASFRLILC